MSTKRVEETVRGGMVPETWNLAVRVQAAVRDAIGYPVTLDQALDVAREFFQEYDLSEQAAEWRARLEREADEKAREKIAEQKRISESAGSVQARTQRRETQ